MTVREGEMALFQCLVPEADVTMWRKDGDMVTQSPRKRVSVPPPPVVRGRGLHIVVAEAYISWSPGLTYRYFWPVVKGRVYYRVTLVAEAYMCFFRVFFFVCFVLFCFPLW